MKKLFTSSILLLLTLSYAFAWEGNGTQQSPYLIKNASDLLQLAQSEETFTTKSFEQTQDIDCSSIEQWIPIGWKNSFSGHYNGKNHSIRNLRYISPNGEKIGLFAKTESALIQSLVIDASCYFEGKKEVGALVGYAHFSSFYECVNHATVYSNSEYSSSVGGIIGSGFGVSIRSCENYGLVLTTKANSDRVGGIIGSLFGEEGGIETCKNAGTVSGAEHVGGIVGFLGGVCFVKDTHNQGIVKGSIRVGGVAGIVQVGLIQSAYAQLCTNSGSVSGQEKVGGIVGSSIYTENIYNIGDVTATVSTVGGVIGTGNAKYCYNKGTVSGADLVGGIAGSAGDIEHAANRGHVSGKTNVGGLAGAMPGTENKLINSYAASTMSVEGTATTKGGIVGSLNTGGFINSNEIKNCYWDKTLNPIGGVGNKTENSNTAPFIYSGRTTAELKGESYPATGTFWYFDTNNTNDGYPVLRELSSLNPVKLAQYTVSVVTNEGGSTNLPATLRIAKGGSIGISITPDPMFIVSNITVNGVSKGQSNQVILDNITENKDVSIRFASSASVNESEANPIIKQWETTLQVKNQKGGNVLIYTSQGALVTKYSIASDMQTIDLQSLPKGAYIVRLNSTNGQRIVLKIIR